MPLDMERYSRQVRFPPIGESGQKQLSERRVLVVGAGALGTSSSEMLVRSGVGYVTIVDRDYVEWSNLQRQQLYTEADAKAATPKAYAAAEKLTEVNSEVTIKGYVQDLQDFVAEHSVHGYDLIMDATDNMETRLFVNDLAQKYGIPWIYGGITGSTGITYTIVPGESPCLSCMLKSMPTVNDTCDTVGVISPVIQWVTAHQVTEAFKILTGNTDSLRKTLLYIDMWTNQQASIKADAMKEENCPSCGSRPTYPYLQESSDTKTAVLCGRDTVQIRPAAGQQLDTSEVERKLAKASQKVTVNNFLIHAHLDEDRRIVVFQDGRVLLHGMTNVAEAQAAYDRYIRS